MLRYDKRTIEKRGRRIKNVDFLKAMRKYKHFQNVQVTHFCNTLQSGIMYMAKAEKYAAVFRDHFDMPIEAKDLLGFVTMKKEDLTNV